MKTVFPALVVALVSTTAGAQNPHTIKEATAVAEEAYIYGFPMIAAYKAGSPGNGKPFPDGSKIAKIEWKPKKSTEAPFDVRIPENLQDLFFIEKDSKRFPVTKGWAYAVFDYDPASDKFAPDKTGTINCGFACHTRVAAKDYIFTAYGKR